MPLIGESLDFSFCVGFLHTKSAPAMFLCLFIYRFVYESEVLVTWYLVWVWEDWVPVYCVPFMFHGRPFLFSAVGFSLILKFFRVVLLVHKVSRSRFPCWRFHWVYLSLNFLYKLKFWLQNTPVDRRTPITFAFFLTCMRCFKSETFLPLFLQVFITEDRFVTGAGWLYSQANSHRLGPFDLVQVVPAYIKGLIRKPIFLGLNLSVRVSQKVSDCLRLIHKCLKVLETKRNCYLHWTWTQTYGYLHWTIPVKDRHLWQFLEKKRCFIPF